MAFKVFHGHVALAFGKLFVVFVQDAGKVNVGGHVPAKGLVQVHVFGRGGQPFFPADDVGDAHEVVVHDDGHVVGGEAVAFHKDLIVHFVGVDGDLAPGFVHKADVFVVGELKPHHVFFAVCDSLLGFFQGDGAAEAVVAGHLAFDFLAFAQIVQAFFGTEAVVGVARFQQLIHVFFVDVQSLGLDVGAAVPFFRDFSVFHHDAFVDFKARPVQGADQVFDGAFHKAGSVRVFDAEQEFSAFLSRI